MRKNYAIKSIRGREILDSKGNPTLKVYLETEDNESSFSVPAGVSEGKYEALDIRDNDKNRYFGKGVRRAVEKINRIIAPKLKGEDVTKQEKIDRLLIKLDGTNQKSNLGGNTILGVSVASLKAAAEVKKIPLWNIVSRIFFKDKKKISRLPLPSVLLIEGALHGGNDLQFQEFMIIPQLKEIEENIRSAAEIYHTLKTILKEKYGATATNVGLEGGFAPPLNKAEKALDVIMAAIKKSNYLSEVKIAIDVAASTFFQKNSYKFENKFFTGSGLLNYYSEISKNYPVASIEDPYFEEDWENFKLITQKLKNKVTIFGDDLLATNPERIKRAAKLNACNGLILKPDQIGTVTEAIEAARLARQNKWKIMVSHRGGDTCDSFIADFAVGIEADFTKFGAPSRGERVARYNRLLEIVEELS
ncbi:MAG: phosphopyruvate hydratase [Patescibacteria group bacterium]